MSAVWRTTPQADAKELQEGEEVTLMDWGNAVVKVGWAGEMRSHCSPSLLSRCLLKNTGHPHPVNWALDYGSQSILWQSVQGCDSIGVTQTVDWLCSLDGIC